jgi:hypothetical protein
MEAPSPKVYYSRHALQRINEREISVEEVLAVLLKNDVIKAYPDDKPYPSRLFLGFPEGRPVHVHASFDTTVDSWCIITAYEPDPEKWEPDFRRKKQ